MATDRMRALILEGRAAGVRDDYEFAEWLVDEKSHFGPSELMSETDLESAWLEAQNGWRMYAREEEPDG
jgi:hypothetical protein